jgi:transcription elongation GreA/GreB family factor
MDPLRASLAQSVFKAAGVFATFPCSARPPGLAAIDRALECYLRMSDRWSGRKSEPMSVAFVREDSAETAAEVEFPARPISPHPNLLTASGLIALKNAMMHARLAYDAARQIEDVNERRRATALALREANYLSQRLNSAQVVPPPSASDIVSFGSRVSLRRDDGRRQVFMIVGEAEANPREGSISFVSPLARALLGKAVADAVAIGDGEIEITAIA